MSVESPNKRVETNHRCAFCFWSCRKKSDRYGASVMEILAGDFSVDERSIA